MANNQENQTVTDGSQNAGQTVTANTGTDYIANSVDETENGPDWKALSRKHEKQAKDNYEQLRKTEAAYEESQSQLHDLQVENARMKAQKAHPQISDDVFALCGETEPEKISEWAEKYAALNPVTSPVKAEPVREKAEQGARTRGEGDPKIRSGSFADGYAAAKACQEQRRQARSAK